MSAFDDLIPGQEHGAGSAFSDLIAKPQQAEGRTAVELLKDTGAGILRGTLSVAKAGALVGDALTHRQGFDNPALRFLDEFGESVDAQKSDYLRGKESASQESIRETGRQVKERFGDGALGTAARVASEFGVGAKNILTEPALMGNFIAEQVPMLGTMRAGSLAAEGIAGAATRAAPKLMATRAGQAVASRAGTAGAVGAGMGLQGVDVAEDAYGELIALPTEVWRNHPDFDAVSAEIGPERAKVAIANREAAAAGGKAALASLLTTLIPGGASLEKAIAGKGGMSFRAVPGAIVGEARQEGLEEGFGKLYGNQAVATANPEKDVWEDVGGAAGQGAVGGGLLGGGMTAGRVASGMVGEKIRNTPEASQQDSFDAAEILDTPESPVQFSDDEKAGITQFAQDRQAEIERKASGTPDQTITGPDGAPIIIPGEQPQYLTPTEKAERDFLAQSAGDPDAVAKAYGIQPTPKAKQATTEELNQELIDPVEAEQADQRARLAELNKAMEERYPSVEELKERRALEKALQQPSTPLPGISAESPAAQRATTTDQPATPLSESGAPGAVVQPSQQPSAGAAQPDTNGFIAGPNGYRTRISEHKAGSNFLDPTADIGAITYEVRKGDSDSKPLNMVLGKDGKLVEAGTVIDAAGKSNGTAWVPRTAVKRGQVIELLQRRATTEIGSQERRDIDARIAEIVTGKVGAGKTATEFIKAPDGSIDFGEIPLLSSKLTDGKEYPPEPIRMEVGGDFGKAHIQPERLAEFQENGYATEAEMLDDVAKHYTHIYEQPNGRLLLVKRNGRAKFSVVELQPHGGYYGATTLFLEDQNPRGKLYEERGGRVLLWPIAGAASSGSDATFPAATINAGAEAADAGESSSTIVDPQAEGNKFKRNNPDSLNDAERELRAAARDTEQDGDVLLGNGKYAPFVMAVKLAREGIESGAFKAAPAQLHFNLDMAMRDVDRVLAAAIKPDATIQTKQTDSGVAMFSRTEDTVPASQQLSAAQLVDIADQAFSQLGHQPNLVIEDSAGIVTGRAEDFGRAAGMVAGGRIYLFRDGIKDAGDAVRTIWHELLHYGIRRFLTADQYIEQMRGLASRDPLLKMQANAWVKSSKDAQRAREYAEGREELKNRVDAYVFARGVDEALAKFAETIGPNNREYANNSVHKRVLRNVREWLAGLADALNLGDVASWLRAMDSKEARQYVHNIFGMLRGNAAATSDDVMFTADGAFMTAWHGSPHDHDGFSTAHIGTGEGAQAYGWGLYFASARAVAEHYRDILSGNKSVFAFHTKNVDYWKLNGVRYFGELPHVAKTYMEQAASIDGAITIARKHAELNGPRSGSAIGLRDLMELKALGEWAPVFKSNGHLYQVELAPSEDEYLDWDKPLSEQSEKVKAALEPFADKLSGMNGDAIYRAFSGTVGRLWKRETGAGIVAGVSGDKAASEYLHSLGIRGIRYLDGSSRNRPLKDIKAEFLAELPEDADTAEVMEMVGTGRFSPKNEALIKALATDDWLGFDYPAQAISAALGNSLSNYDASPALLQAVSDAKDGGTHNYVIFDDADVTITAKLSRGAGRGMSLRDLQAVVDRLAPGLKNLPRVHVMESPADLSTKDPSQKALRDYIKSRDAMDDADGAMHDGEIYLFASGMAGELRAEHVLATHEATHYGLRGAVGKELDAALQHVWLHNGKVRKAAQAVRDADETIKSNVEAVEEVLADMPSAELVKLTGWRKVVKVIRDWLKKAGAERLAARLDMWLAAGLDEQQQADLFVADLVTAAREWVRTGKGQAVMTGTRLADPTLADDMARQEKWLHQEATSRGFKTIDDLAEKNYPLFEKLAAMWRKKNPVEEALLSRNVGAGNAASFADAVKAVISDSIAGRRLPSSPVPVSEHSPATLRIIGWDDLPVAMNPKEIDKVHFDHGMTADRIARLVPETLESPALMLLSATVPGRIVLVAREAGNKPVLLVVSPEVDVHRDGSPQRKGHLIVSMYPKDEGWDWVARQIRNGNLLYRDHDSDAAGKVKGAIADAQKDFAQTGRKLMGLIPKRGAELLGDGYKVLLPSDLRKFDESERQNSLGGVTRLSRAAVQGQQPAQTVAERADAIIQAKSGTAKPLEAIFKTATQAVQLDKLTAALYNKAAFFLDRHTPETLKAGIVADYGIPEAVLDQRAAMQGRMRGQLRKTGELIEKLSMLTREESRVAYAWMNNADPQASAYLEQQLPPDSVKVMGEVKQLIDQLSREAVRLGQLDPATYEKNRYEYLRRTYAKHVAEQTTGERKGRQRAIAILGEQYKGRGMTDAVDMVKIKAAAPEWWGRKLQAGKADKGLKGERFIRLERRAPSGEGTAPMEGMGERQRGRLQEVAYWPAGEPVPAKYAAWDQAGTWEVRDTKGGKLVMWRDFTKQERETMGEIDEARFAIARTMQGMIHDVEVGRFLEWLSVRYAKKEGERIDGQIVEASERMRDTFKPGEWVQVPDTKIPGTQVKKYGILAGRYLPGPIWNDVRQVAGGRYKPFGEIYAAVLGAWKTAKTALSPAVHMNNVMANVVMADWHDVTAGHIHKALNILLAANDGKLGLRDKEAATEILNRYRDSGGGIGTWITQELQREQLEPLMQALEAEIAQAGNSPGAQIAAGAIIEHLKAKDIGAAWATLKQSASSSKAGKGVVWTARKMIDMYEAEDQVFRLAAWLKAKEEGAADLAAGKASRKSFLDYHINAPWIQMMRQTALPFIAFTYRALPMFLETAAKKPWKLMKLAGVIGALNALGYALSGGDEDDERRFLPEEKAGNIYGIPGIHKLVRMPWNDIHSQPVFLDIRRFVPVGDVFDLGQTHSAVPILPFAVPGGPLALLGELVANKSQFTGRAITLETDTQAEKAEKVFDHVYKAFAPNVVVLPGTYAFTGAMNASTGKTDAFGRELSPTQAMLSSIGIKVGSYPQDVLKLNAQRAAQAKLSEIDRNITALKRERMRNGIDDAEFREKVGAQQAKQKELVDELRAK